MGIVQKRADELKRGDVLADGRVVVSKVERSQENNISAFMHGEGESRTFEYFMPGERIVDVESPDLTPAQQHAEELAEAGKLIANQLVKSFYPAEMIVAIETMRALLDKIKPPEPPTLEEALASLAVASGHLLNIPSAGYKKMVDVLERGRRSGVLK